MNQDIDKNRIHRLRHSAFVYSFFCLYLILFQLSMPPKSKEPGSPKKPTAKWNSAETESLITFLHGEADRNGTTSFKESSFTAAANHIKHLHTDGPVKTAAHCRTKWATQAVSSYSF